MTTNGPELCRAEPVHQCGHGTQERLTFSTSCRADQRRNPPLMHRQASVVIAPTYPAQPHPASRAANKLTVLAGVRSGSAMSRRASGRSISMTSAHGPRPLALNPDFLQPRYPGHAFTLGRRTDATIPNWHLHPQSCGSPSNHSCPTSGVQQFRANSRRDSARLALSFS